MRQEEIETLRAAACEELGRIIFDEVNPGYVERLRSSAIIPGEVLRSLAAVGLTSYTMPVESGGQGRSMLEWGILLEQLNRTCSDFGVAQVLVRAEMVADELTRAPDAALVEAYARPIAAGDIFATFAFADVTDQHLLPTLATTGDGWVFDGTFGPVPVAGAAQVFLLFGYDEEADETIGVFVDAHDEGVTRERADTAGLRTASLSMVTLTDVRVPKQRLVVPGHEPQRLTRFKNKHRILQACASLGWLRQALDKSIELATTKIRHGQTVAEFHNVQAALGRVYSILETNRALTYTVLERFEHGADDDELAVLCAVARHHGSESALEAAWLMTETHGTEGFLTEYGFSQNLPDAGSMLVVDTPPTSLEVELGISAITQYQLRAQLRDEG